LYFVISHVAISGEKAPAKIDAKLYPSETPLYRRTLGRPDAKRLIARQQANGSRCRTHDEQTIVLRPILSP